MFNMALIAFTAIVVTGVMELIKVFFTNMGPKVKAAISLVLSIGIGIGVGFFLKLETAPFILSVLAAIAITQLSYDFLIKLIKKIVALLEAKVDEYILSKPLVEKQIEKEIKELEEENKTSES